MDDLTFIEQTVLDNLKERLKQQDSEDDRLDRKSQMILQALSIILAFVSGFKLETALRDPYKGWLFVLIFVAYVCIVAICFYILLPKDNWAHGLSTSKDGIRKILRQGEDKFYIRLVATYSKMASDNDIVLHDKGRALKWAMLLMVIDVLLMVIAVAV